MKKRINDDNFNNAAGKPLITVRNKKPVERVKTFAGETSFVVPNNRTMVNHSEDTIVVVTDHKSGGRDIVGMGQNDTDFGNFTNTTCTGIVTSGTGGGGGGGTTAANPGGGGGTTGAPTAGSGTCVATSSGGGGTATGTNTNAGSGAGTGTCVASNGGGGGISNPTGTCTGTTGGGGPAHPTGGGGACVATKQCVTASTNVVKCLGNITITTPAPVPMPFYGGGGGGGYMPQMDAALPAATGLSTKTLMMIAGGVLMIGIIAFLIGEKQAA